MDRNAFLAMMGIGVILEVVGDVLFKKWADGGHRWWLVAGFLIYSAGSISWAWSLKHEMISKAIVLFTLANIVLVVLAGYFFFHERLTVLNWIGIALALAAVVLVEM